MRRRAGTPVGPIDWVSTVVDPENRLPSDRTTLKTLHRWSREPVASEIWVALLDVSGSLIARGAIARAKGAIIDLCDQAYRRRFELELITFGNQRVDTAQRRRRPPRDVAAMLDRLGSGGGTPLRRAMVHTAARLQQLARQCPQRARRAFIFTDARSRDPIGELSFDAEVTVIDTEQSPIRLGRARTLAGALHANYLHIDDLEVR